MATNNKYTPAEYNTGIVRGDFFTETFTFTIDSVPFDVNTANSHIQIRSLADGFNPSTIGSILGDYRDGNGLTHEDNSIIWEIEDTETATFIPGAYAYDLELIIDNKPKTYIRGRFTVENDITQKI